MAVNFIENVADYSHDNGRKFLSVVNRRRLLKNMICDTIQTISGASLAAYTWNSNYHPLSTILFSTIGAAGVVGLCANMRKYFRKSPDLQLEGDGSARYLTTGTLTYSASVYALSEGLKREEKIWIGCFGVAAFGYCLTASSVGSLGRTVKNMNPFTKCGQVMFRPILTACTAFYLRCLRKHKELWLFHLPMFVSALEGNHIGFLGSQRVENSDEPNWLLFKGIERFLGGLILFVNGSVMVIYTINGRMHAIVTIFYSVGILNGITDVLNSLKVFQKYSELETRVFDCLCGMIIGPVICLLACVAVKCTQNPMLMITFYFPVGIGLTIIAKSISNIYYLVPRREFYRYNWRVFGPVATMFGSLAISYVGYHMGWRCSLVPMPLILVGMFFTYRGFMNIDELW